MATIKDIANKLGVSISTVSKGLNGASDVSNELRQTILDTAVEMGYTTKRMKKEENKKLCVFIENIEYESSSNFGYDVVLGFKQAASRDNWSVTVLPISSDFQTQEKYDTFMLKNGFSGAFTMALTHYDAWLPQLEHTTIPTALLDTCITRNPNVSYIGTDNFEGINAAVDHLAELGHTKIAFLNGTLHCLVTEERQQAYYDSLAAHNIPVNDSLVANSFFTSESAKHFVPSFLDHGATAILCGSDLIAYGVMKECAAQGLRVPEDVSVIGFDDLPLSAHTTPPLTTIRQDRVELGKCGYMTLHSLMNHVPVSKTLLRPQLIIRNSTAKAIDR